jgi:hypothetical protein
VIFGPEVAGIIFLGIAFFRTFKLRRRRCDIDVTVVS